MSERVGLHSLKPAKGSRKARKRVGRGNGGAGGTTAGRGTKGYGARSGAKDRPRFEGGQNPIHMRMRKLRGPHMKKSMPFEPFRTHTQPVNLRDLEARFDAGADVSPDTLVAKGLLKNTKVDVKILGSGELTKKLSVTAHGFSKSAREKIEAAGGSVTWLRGEPVVRTKKVRTTKPKADLDDDDAVETSVERESSAEEPEAEEASD